MKNKLVKNILYGFLAWLIPFISAFFFYSREGELSIDIFLFKSIMIVVGTITAVVLLVSYFKTINKDYVKEGVLIGIVWLAISILLDVLILIPMSGMTMGEYFTQIGLRYLSIPAISIAMGVALANNK